MSSPANSNSTNADRLWFQKGFIEGLKRSPSDADNYHAQLSFDLIEARIQIGELTAKVTDLAEMLLGLYFLLTSSANTDITKYLKSYKQSWKTHLENMPITKIY